MLPVCFLLSGLGQTMQQLSPTRRSSFPSFWLVAIPTLLVSVPVIVVTVAAYATSRITLTNRRLIFRTGFLSRRSGELPLQNIESIFIIEPLLGRLFGFGTVAVTSVGGSTFPFYYMRMPQLFHVTLQDAVNEAKNHPVLSATPTPTPPGPQDDSRYMPKSK